MLLWEEGAMVCWPGMKLILSLVVPCNATVSPSLAIRNSRLVLAVLAVALQRRVRRLKRAGHAWA